MKKTIILILALLIVPMTIAITPQNDFDLRNYFNITKIFNLSADFGQIAGSNICTVATGCGGGGGSQWPLKSGGGLGNFSGNLGLNWTNVENSIGNWSNDKSTLPNLSWSDIYNDIYNKSYINTLVNLSYQEVANDYYNKSHVDTLVNLTYQDVADDYYNKSYIDTFPNLSYAKVAEDYYNKSHVDTLVNGSDIWNQSGNDIFLSDTNYSLGVGLGNPSYKLHVVDNTTNTMNIADTLFVEGVNRYVGINGNPDRELLIWHYFDGTPAIEIYSQDANDESGIAFVSGFYEHDWAVGAIVVDNDWDFTIANSQDMTNSNVFTITRADELVGIGTLRPQYKLEVQGNFSVNGTSFLGDNLNVNDVFNVSASQGTAELSGNLTVAGLNIDKINSTHWRLWG